MKANCRQHERLQFCFERPPAMTQSTFQWEPLGPSSIRVLTLYPGSFNDGIKISLRHESLLDESVEYEGLSYFCGEQDPASPIVCNEVTLYVTTNQLIALRYLRHETTPRDMWIDGICINQDDIAERNEQVQMMG